MHIVIALSGIVQATLLLISPTNSKFRFMYILLAMAIASGTYLTWISRTHILSACVSGLLYIGVIAAAVLAARHKLSLQTINNKKYLDDDKTD